MKKNNWVLIGIFLCCFIPACFWGWLISEVATERGRQLRERKYLESPELIKPDMIIKVGRVDNDTVYIYRLK